MISQKQKKILPERKICHIKKKNSIRFEIISKNVEILIGIKYTGVTKENIEARVQQNIYHAQENSLFF